MPRTLIHNSHYPHVLRCDLHARLDLPRRDCIDCRTIQGCRYYVRTGLIEIGGRVEIAGMNWINLITLILTLAETELPAVEGLIASIKGSTPAHQSTINLAVAAALQK
jgi:hypothetical protein